MLRRRMFLFLGLYVVFLVVCPIGLHEFESLRWLDAIYETVMNAALLGGGGQVLIQTALGHVWMLAMRTWSMVCIGGMLYTALQQSLFDSVDIVATERRRRVQAKPIDVFVCYRRSDSSGYAGRLFDMLSSFFGPEHIFMDIDAIPPGQDFEEIIKASLQGCDVSVILIGPHWLESPWN